MRIIKIPREEFERLHPHSGGFHYTTEGGEHIIEVPSGVGTKTLMHEVAHAELGHETKPSMMIEEWAQRELAADKWVYEKLGREPSWGEILYDFVPIMEQGFDIGYSQNDLFNFVKKECEEAGYLIEDKEKSFIWEFVRRVYRSRRKRTP